jgi:tRNA (cytidine32/uridine32-2'-O)-methyltransferase
MIELTSSDPRLGRVAIVLVEPSHPGNIGGAARAMKNMGLATLRLVSPRRFPDPQAEWRAAGALDVLDQAQVFPRLDAAIADCHHVIGTGMLDRRIPWPILDAAGAAAEVLALPADARVAIVFGREASGLNNDELQQCNAHLQIPSSAAYGSLNLAMAVQVVAYELFRQSQMGAVETAAWDRPLATAEHVQGLLGHFEEVLIASGFVDRERPGQTMTRLRRLFLRQRLDDTEVQILRGVLTTLDPRAGGQPAGPGSGRLRAERVVAAAGNPPAEAVGDPPAE